MTIRVVTVLGGTGFLGRRIVQNLRKQDFSVRVASRHPKRCQELFGTADPHILSVRANVRDKQSIADAIAGAQAVVNTVSPTSSSSNATGGDPLHGPVLFPHISVRTDDAPRTRVYFVVHTGMANARVPPLAPSRNGSPGLPRPPDAGRGFSFRLAMTVLPLLQGLVLRSRASLRTLQCWTCASNASGLHWAEAVFAQGGFHAHNRGRSNLVRCSLAFQWGAR
jgi:hypothetical protein